MELGNILPIVGLTILLLLEGFFEVALLSLLGAYTRRVFGDKKKKFKAYYNENKIINSIIGLIVLIILFVIVVGSIKLFL